MNVRFLLTFLSTILLLGACTGDDERFVSYPPKFSEIRITDLNGQETIPQVGVPFIATVIQSQHGKLLNTTRYSWSVENSHDWKHSFVQQVIYDKERTNPCDTIIANQTGSFTLQFRAIYNTSAQMKSQAIEGDLKDGTAVSYTLSPLKAVATLRKTIVVN